MKICSLYGEGFFYIPGTDTCIKIGGWVRAEYTLNEGNSGNPYLTGGSGRNNRIDTNDTSFRSRYVMSFDVRTQTEYGTLRAYYRAGFELTSSAMGGGQGTFYTERGFIQFAGFTAGKSQSYFDFYNGVFSYGGGFLGGGSNTGASGTTLLAYTAQFGSGWSATISAEDNTYRRNAIWDAGTNALAIGSLPGPNGWVGTGYQFSSCGAAIITPDGNANFLSTTSPNGTTALTGTAAVSTNSLVGCPTGDYAAQQIPDIVGNLRVDQAWGSAQIAGALHQVRTGYYGNNATNNLFTGPGGYTGVAPEDKWGWAVMGGVVINLLWSAGDKFWVEGTYTQGALAYTAMEQAGQNGYWQRFSGNTVAAGWNLDALFANRIAATTATAPGGGVAFNPSGTQLTTAWTVGAALEHYWTPALRTSLWGVYTEVDYNGTATAIFCSSPNSPVRALTSAPGVSPLTGTAGSLAAAPIAGCNPDFKIWGAGVRTIWNPVKNLDVGLEVMYSKLDQNMDASRVGLNFGGSGGRVAGIYAPADQDVWSGLVRIQRNFWP